jgi:hypothetical protein
MALAARPTFSDPSYQVRQSLALGAIAAGAAGQSSKFVAHAALVLYAISAYTLIAGTSTYTYTGQNGTSTIAIAAQQVSVIRVFNTATPGGSVALSTTTLGPFALTGAFNAAGTYTNQVGAFTQWALNTGSGTAGYGGIPVNAGDYIYVVSGTDATASEVVTVDYQINTGAGLTV